MFLYIRINSKHLLIIVEINFLLQFIEHLEEALLLLLSKCLT